MKRGERVTPRKVINAGEQGLDIEFWGRTLHLTQLQVAWTERDSVTDDLPQARGFL